MMKRMKWTWALAAGMVVGAWVCPADAATLESYTKIDAASLVSAPQNAWARAILFSDILETLPHGRHTRLDRRNYVSMGLKRAGTVWVPQDLVPKFEKLTPGQTYSFAGTVDQIRRRYYVIVDACYVIQTAEDMSERWVDMLDPDVRVGESMTDISETLMQSLLVDAQNTLIQMAREHNLTVAQLIEAQTDGGQRIAESIVAESLRGKLHDRGTTADELMVGSVLALLQRQAIQDESVRIADERARLDLEPEPMPAADEPAPVAVAVPWEEEEPAPVELPPEEPVVLPPEALIEETAVAVEKIPADDEPEPDAGDPEVVPELPVEPLEDPAFFHDEVWPEYSLDFTDEELEEAVPDVADVLPPAIEPEPAPPVPAPEVLPIDPEPIPPVEEWAVEMEDEVAAEIEDEMIDMVEPIPDGEGEDQEEALPEPMDDILPVEDEGVEELIEFEPGPTVEEEMAAIRPPDISIPDIGRQPAEPVAPPPSTMLVVPMTEPGPEVVPLVSMEPTKAELAEQRRQEAAQLRDEWRQTRVGARKLAAEEKRAAKEAKKAERARVRAEARQARVEAAARKTAEREARREAARAEAEAKQALQERARQLALEEKDALDALRQADLLTKQEEDARRQREKTEQRLAELTTRRQAAEIALREVEQQRQAELERIQQEVAAQAAAETAAREARMAEEEARKAESIRIVQEVTQHERRVAEEAAVRIEEERAARQAAEERLRAMENEIRELEARARQIESRLPAQRDAERRVREREPVARPEPDPRVDAAPPTLTSREQRRLDAAARREADAAAKARAEAEKQVPVDPDDLPEWMRPVHF